MGGPQWISIYGQEHIKDWSEITVDDQLNLLTATVRSHTSQKYPQSVSYRRSFLQYIINQLEKNNVEVCDALYDELGQQFLCSEEEEGNYCFKTYTLEEDMKITMRETKQIISHGTTGLCTWQAAQFLVEWIIENKHLIENRHVLELGSGLGFTGLAACVCCQPASYTFTDCHLLVLRQLVHNIHTNLTSIIQSHGQTKSKDINNDLLPGDTPAPHSQDNPGHAENVPGGQPSLGDVQFDKSLKQSEKLIHENDMGVQPMDTNSRPSGARCGLGQSENVTPSLCESSDADFVDLYETLWKRSSDRLPCWQCRQSSIINVACLDWDSLQSTDMDIFGDVQVIIAADVVYDVEVVPALVRVLHLFLAYKKSESVHRLAYIASTVRNPETRNYFLEALGECNIIHRELPGPNTSFLYYDKSVPIQLLELSLKN